MSTPENNTSQDPQGSDIPQKISSLLHLLYVLSYILGAQIIRFYFRLVRRIKHGARRLNEAAAKKYAEFKDRQEAKKPVRVDWKQEWIKAFRDSGEALIRWKQNWKQPGYGIRGLFKAVSPAARKITGGINYILPVVGIIILTNTILHFSTITYGLRVQYNGEHIGYILSEDEFIQAEIKVKERIVNEEYLPPQESVPIYSLEIVEEEQISPQSVLINNIIRSSGNDIEEAAGLYVDDEFIGAVEDGDALLASLKSRKDGTYDPNAAAFNEAEEAEEIPQQEEVPEEAPEPEESVPEPEPEPEPETPKKEKEHIVSAGDTPWDIAVKYDISVDDLLAKNPNLSKSMHIGDVVIIPGVESSEASTPEKKEEPKDENPEVPQKEKEYTVENGDTPWDIAVKHDISVDELLKKNPGLSQSMHVGDVIIIPGVESPKEEPKETPKEEPKEEPKEAPKEESKEEPKEEPKETPKEEKEYTVKSGDSPWAIAMAHDISVDDLIKRNPEISQSMKIGDVLIIPGSESSKEESSSDKKEDVEKAPNSPKEVVSFVQSIRLEQGLYPVSSVESIADINKKLDRVVEGQQDYTVQEGDSPWSIANKFDLPLQTLQSLNPDAKMMVGDTFIISREQPFLQTKMVRTETEEKEIPFQTEKEIDKNKKKSYQKVLQEGEKGLKEVTSEITFIDGYETERKVISEEVLKEPVTAKVVVGSLGSSGSAYNFSGGGSDSTESNLGGYIWPVNGGYISCPIWGYSGHTGTDIAAPAGTTIWASKAGTVIYAGWSRGYGYNILLQHPDGTKTRYAHCSSLAVYQGQQVTQGQVIGYVGRTGNATGNHCHFEIISPSGSFLDARNYIGYSR